MSTLGSKHRDGFTTGAIAVLAVFLVAAAAQGAAAQNAEDCTAITDRDARLACYDRLHGRSLPATPAPSVPAPAGTGAAPAAAPAEPLGSSAAPREPEEKNDPVTTAAPAVAPSVADSPDLGAEQLPKSREERAAEKRPDEMLSTVATMGESSTRKHWFRLENGQLWEQVSIETTNIREGDAVRVSRGLFGSYTMRRADGGSRSTRVQRRE